MLAASPSPQQIHDLLATSGYWQNAQPFRQTLNILDDVRGSQGDLGSNEDWAKEIAGEIAKCDAALGK